MPGISRKHKLGSREGDATWRQNSFTLKTLLNALPLRSAALKPHRELRKNRGTRSCVTSSLASNAENTIAGAGLDVCSIVLDMLQIFMAHRLANVLLPDRTNLSTGLNFGPQRPAAVK